MHGHTIWQWHALVCRASAVYMLATVRGWGGCARAARLLVGVTGGGGDGMKEEEEEREREREREGARGEGREGGGGEVSPEKPAAGEL